MLPVHGLEIFGCLVWNKGLAHTVWSRRPVQSFGRNAMFPSSVLKKKVAQNNLPIRIFCVRLYVPTAMDTDLAISWDVYSFYFGRH